MKSQSLLLLLLIILLSACQQSPPEVENLEMMEEMIPVTKQELASPLPPIPEDVSHKQINKKKIIKEGSIVVEVTDLAKAKQCVDSIAKNYGAYYSKENYNDFSSEKNFQLTLRIPVKNFDSLIAQIEKGAGETRHKNIDARDVSDQFIDLESRLSNKKAYLVRYRELLKKAKTVKDILQIEEEIRGIEEEIESTEGRLKYLEDQVQYSTLHLTLSHTKEEQVRHSEKFTKRVFKALAKGWNVFVNFIVFLIHLWPFVLLLSLAIIVWRRYKKRRKAKA